MIYSIVPNGSSEAIDFFSRLSTWTGGRIFTPNLPEEVATDFLTAITDIRNNPNFPNPAVSTLEPSTLWEFFTLGLLGISYTITKRHKKSNSYKGRGN